MAWRIVQQPNGLLARFSDIVDDFTHLDMNDEEAFTVCSEFMDEADVPAKIQRGKDAPDRWFEAITKIRLVHGDEMAESVTQFGNSSPSEEKNLEFDKLLGLEFVPPPKPKPE